MRTKDAMGRFLTAKDAAGYSPRTLANYRVTLTQLAARYPELPTLPEQIENFLAHWTATVTKDTKDKHLRAFYRWLVARKAIAKKADPMPFVERQRLRPRWARSFTVAEVNRLFAYPHSPHMRLMLLLMLDTGLRREEAWGLRPENVKDRTVVVWGKNGAREVPISPAVRNVLRQLLPFPWKTPESAGQLVRRAFRLAGIEGRRASAHTIRVTWARLSKMDKLNKKRAGGWRSWKMLEHYLGDITEETIEQHARGTPLHLFSLLSENTDPSPAS